MARMTKKAQAAQIDVHSIRMTQTTVVINEESCDILNQHTPASRRAAGAEAMAAWCEKRKMTRDVFFAKDGHTYVVTEYTDGRISTPIWMGY